MNTAIIITLIICACIVALKLIAEVGRTLRERNNPVTKELARLIKGKGEKAAESVTEEVKNEIHD